VGEKLGLIFWSTVDDPFLETYKKVYLGYFPSRKTLSTVR